MLAHSTHTHTCTTTHTHTHITHTHMRTHTALNARDIAHPTLLVQHCAPYLFEKHGASEEKHPGNKGRKTVLFCWFLMRT